MLEAGTEIDSTRERCVELFPSEYLDNKSREAGEMERERTYKHKLERGPGTLTEIR